MPEAKGFQPPKSANVGKIVDVNMTIEADQVDFKRDVIVNDGCEIKIEDGGELMLL